MKIKMILFYYYTVVVNIKLIYQCWGKIHKDHKLKYIFSREIEGSKEEQKTIILKTMQAKSTQADTYLYVSFKHRIC